MNHKVNLSTNEKNVKIDLLRKQRDGAIIGSYRNILAEIYKNIKEASIINNGTCFVKSLLAMYMPSTQHKKMSFWIIVWIWNGYEK